MSFLCVCGGLSCWNLGVQCTVAAWKTMKNSLAKVPNVWLKMQAGCDCKCGFHSFSVVFPNFPRFPGLPFFRVCGCNKRSSDLIRLYPYAFFIVFPQFPGTPGSPFFRVCGCIKWSSDPYHAIDRIFSAMKPIKYYLAISCLILRHWSSNASQGVSEHVQRVGEKIWLTLVELMQTISDDDMIWFEIRW